MIIACLFQTEVVDFHQAWSGNISVRRRFLCLSSFINPVFTDLQKKSVGSEGENKWKEVEMAEDLGLDLAGLGGPELQNLPVEVLDQIFGHLDPASVKTASLVSR